MSYNRIFPYHWVIDDKEEHITSIRIYGIGENNDNICVRIENFTPWVYIELPPEKNWTALKAQKLGEKIDELIPSHKPLKKTFVMREKLYNANIRILEDGKIEKKLFPYLFCTFANRNDIKQLMYKMKKPIALVGVGLIKIKMHEQDADPILQLVSCKDIPTAGWIEFVGEEMTGGEKVTLCHKEYKVKWKNLKKYEENNSVGNPKIMGFDIEVNSTNVNAMPKAEKPGDKVFQISCVFRREGTNENDVYLLTLGEADSEIVGDDVNIYCYETEADLLEGFTELIRTENPNVIAGYNILGFDIPYMIERAKHNLCISSFDLMGFHKYKHAKEKTIVWSSSAYKNQEFSFLDAEGRLFVDLLPLIRRDFKFDNYKLSTVSDIFIGDNKKDLPPKGIFKCYREGIVREPDGTFGAKAIKAMSKCGAYCVQDSVLVIKLMDKLQTWVGLTEMACTFNTQIFTLYTQGQQIKVYSQVYKYCTFHNIVVEKDGYITKENDRYVGAHVFPPVPGVYDRVVPFDFASLYPTTIIAYNIDYSTIVFDESIPDSMCHVFTWRDDLGCIHDPKVIRKNELTEYINKETEYIKELRKQRDETKNKVYKVQIAEQITKRMEELKPYRDERSAITKTITKNPMCEQRYFRFLKEPKGVIPTILQNLLDMRKQTRKHIKNTKCKHPDCGNIAEYGIDKALHCLGHKDQKEIKILNDAQIKDIVAFNGVLDKRQLAYKVSANSMYGAFGVKKGYLPFMPGAMCLVGDSLISFSYGFTRRIENLKDTDCLWSYKDGQVIADGNGLKYNGKKEIVKVTLIDGRILRCTPDHKIMTTSGWIEAGKLLSKHEWDGETFTTNSEYSKVVVGLELPEDIVGEDEKWWKLLDYKMNTSCDREKTLAFCRMLGFILADGTISSYLSKYNKNLTSCTVSLGTLLDANIFVNDIKLLTDQCPKITNCERDEIKGNIYCVHVPKILVDQILLLDGVPIGKRSHQPYTLPTFLFEANCPLSVVREFLGGLFGGDGTSPSLSKSHPSFSPIQLGLTTIEKYKDDMADTMNKLVLLLKRFDMNFWCSKPRLARVRENLKAKDADENPRWEYMVTTNCCFSLLFAEKIGFRYCSDKNNKLGVASSYQRYSDNVRRQHINLILTATDMYEKNNKKINVKNILPKARKEVYQNDFPLHEYASLSKPSHVHNHRSRPHSLKDFKLLQKFFPSAREYTKLVGCEHWFSEEKCLSKVYSMKRTDMISPCLYLDVVDVRSDGIQDVYDIIDVPNNSFFANGIVVHNCTTFMGRTNIEIVAKTIQEKHKGHLVYGDSVSGDTPILIRYPDSKIDIKTIESLNDMWMPYEEFKSEDSNRKEKQQSIVNLEVWTNGKWSKIKRVIRHKTKKRMFRINTHKGSIDVSEDHSLLNENSEKVKPTEVDIGYKLLHSFPSTEGLKNLELTQDEIQFKNKKMDRVSCIGKLQAQRLYYIMKSLGVENINISNEDNTYILSLVDKDYCKNFNEIKEIIELPPVDENTFIYDLETEEGKFHAGVGEIVVKNTDSNYIHFPHLKGATETWDYAEHVASEITKLFPRPIELEFESTIYFLFFILTKKRYMYLACDKEGNVESKVGKKGVLLNRRDSSLFVRDIYEAIIKKIFEKVTRHELLYFILEEINKLCSGYFDVKYFRVTKSVGSVDDLNIVPFVGEKGEKKVKIGNYTIKALPTDVEERKKQLLKKEAVDAKDYYVKSLPAQVQLAEKMRRRGKRVDAGSRLEYLVIDNGINNDKQYNKIEDIDYFKEHSDVLKVDYMYYLKALVNPLDQVLNIYFNRDKKFKGDFILHQYDFRSKIRRKVLEDIRQLFIPKMVFK